MAMEDIKLAFGEEPEPVQPAQERHFPLRESQPQQLQHFDRVDKNQRQDNTQRPHLSNQAIFVDGGQIPGSLHEPVGFNIGMDLFVTGIAGGENPDVMAQVQQAGDLAEDKGFRQVGKLAKQKGYFHGSASPRRFG